MSADLETRYKQKYVSGAQPFSAYQRRLFVLLSVATFFEGYDYFALAQALPLLRDQMHLSKTGAGWLVGFINVGALISYLLVRHADRVGRRPLLTLTLGGYTVCSLLSGVSPNVYVFAVAQLFARMFLLGEWALTMVYAAEEFPATRRGLVLGLFQAFSSLGAIVCAGLAPLLFETRFGWRTVYLVGSLPLGLLFYLRRSLRETSRFLALPKDERAPPSLFRIFKTPHRARVIELAAVWFLSYLCTGSAVTFWNEFAIRERGFTTHQVGQSLTFAAVFAMPLLFFGGKLVDRLGRRAGSAVIYLTAAAALSGAYNFYRPGLLTVALAGGIFGSSAILIVLNALTTERFPTELRGDGFAWSNCLIGRVGFLLSPVLVGALAERSSWGFAVSVSVVGPLAALAVILLRIPETAGRELEDTAAVDPS